MTRVASFAAIWVSILTVAAYFVLYNSAGYLVSKFTADMAALVGLSFMSAATTPVAWRAMRNALRTDRDKYVFSVWLIWTMVLWHRCWIISLGLMRQNYPELYDYWYFSPISGLLALGFGLAAGYGGAATFTGDLPVPKRELIIFSVAAGFSGIMAGIAIGVFVIAGWVN